MRGLSPRLFPGLMARRRAKKLKKQVSSGAFNYCFIFLLSYVANLWTTAYCLHALGWPKQAAYVAALVVTGFVTFLGLRYVVFQRTRKKFLKQLKRFTVASGVLWVLEYILFVHLAASLDYDHRLVITGLTLTLGLARFIILSRFVFR